MWEVGKGPVYEYSSLALASGLDLMGVSEGAA
jgi:hypothetical protein